jgi:competence protein ComEC
VIPISLGPRDGPGDLVVDFLDVGQGDAALITTPGGRQVLIDGGPSGLELARELGDVMPHWDRTIDLVILSHPQEDHLAGLPELAKRFRVDGVRDTGHHNTTTAFREYQDAMTGRQETAAGEASKSTGSCLKSSGRRGTTSPKT